MIRALLMQLFPFLTEVRRTPVSFIISGRVHMNPLYMREIREAIEKHGAKARPEIVFDPYIPAHTVKRVWRWEP